MHIHAWCRVQQSGVSQSSGSRAPLLRTGSLNASSNALCHRSRLERLSGSEYELEKAF